MAITHSTAARNAMANGAVDLVNAGSANAAGIFRFRASNNAVVSNNNLTNPAAPTAVAGVKTFAAIANDTNAAGGTISQATLEDRDRNVVITIGDIRTTAGGDMQGGSLTIAPGSTVSISGLTYTAPQ